MKKYLVFDIGGTAIKFAHMTEDATILEKGLIDTIRDNMEVLVESIGEIYDKYQDDINGIAISLPGVLDSDTGYMYFGGSLHFNANLNFVEVLQKRCPTTITLENDGKSAALAEIWKGSMRGVKHGAVIALGTGVGGGVIIDGKLHKGHGFYAGEFSHVRANCEEPSNPMFSWGALGSVMLLTSKASHAKGVEKMDGYEFFEYANNGDQTILAILDNYTQNIVTQIFNLQAIISPEKIAIGGGISAQPILLEYIKKNIDKMYDQMNQGMFKLYVPKVEIVPCEFRNDSNLIGALFHHLNIINDSF